MIRILVATLGLASVALAEEAGELFKARCASCHTIPDRELKGDRAWLGQVPKTA